VAALKVNLKSPFSILSGYGNDGFGLLRVLDEWGLDVYPQPMWLDIPIPADLLPLFAKELVGPFDLTINHWDPEHLAITEEARRMTRCAVAWTMWEFMPAPKPVEMEWRGKMQVRPPLSGLVPHCGHRSTLRGRLKWYDLVLGYDEVTMASLGPYIPKHVAQGILQGGYPARDWKPAERDWFGERFGFFMHGALNARKCPYTTIQAFNELKYERPEFAGATLSLHTNWPGNVFPEMNNIFEDVKIRVFVGAWDHETLARFYAANHVAVYPSRGEGKNLPALEHLSTGGTGLFTDYGGHRQWLREDIAYPLPYELTPTFPQRPDGAHDAKVEIATVKDAMWHVFTHREEAKRKGELAAELIPKMCDWSVVVEALFRRIRDNVPVVGPQLYDEAMRARERKRERDDTAGTMARSLLLGG
jgi:glycosyltransferase involved in cell wall biosynthesis